MLINGYLPVECFYERKKKMSAAKTDPSSAAGTRETKFNLRPMTAEQFKASLMTAPSSFPTKSDAASSKTTTTTPATKMGGEITMTDVKVPVGGRLQLSASNNAYNFKRQYDAKVIVNSVEDKFQQLIKLVAGQAGYTDISKGWWLFLSTEQRNKRGELTELNFNDEYPRWLGSNQFAIIRAMRMINSPPKGSPAFEACCKITLLNITIQSTLEVRDQFGDIAVCVFQARNVDNDRSRGKSSGRAMEIQQNMVVEGLESSLSVFFNDLIWSESENKWALRSVCKTTTKSEEEDGDSDDVEEIAVKPEPL
jgi:hypothetical protein